MECRVRRGGVRRHDRGVHRGCPRFEARLSAPVGGAADPGTVRRGLLPAASSRRRQRRAQDPSAPVDRRRQCQDHRSRLARGLCRHTAGCARMALGFWRHRRLGQGRRLAFLAAMLATMLTGFADAAAAGERAALDALIHAYPDFLVGYDASELIWRAGTRMPLSEGRPAGDFAEMLRRGSILDQMRLPYPAGPLTAGTGPTARPGRVRNRAFFDKMYGNCWKGEVRPRLVGVVWLPRSWGRTIEATSVNGVAERIAAVSAEVDALPLALKRYAYPPAGTYNCRTVADTGQPSM